MTDKNDQAEWAEICADFHGIRLEANRLGFRPRWQECARSTPGGAESLADWRRLISELSQSAGVGSDFVGRHGETANLARDLRALLGDDPRKEYECPSDLCSRRARSNTGTTPRCELLNAEMRSA